MKVLLWMVLLAAQAYGQVYPYRWVYFTRNLSSDSHVEEFRGVARVASEHGLNGVMLSASFDNIGRQSAAYWRRLGEVRRIAEEYSLEIIPLFYSAGYAGGILSHNRNLAEGIPVKNALFVVSGNEARLEPDPPVEVVNGGFEEYTNHVPRGYRFNDNPGEVTSIDTEVFHGGTASMRFENFAAHPARNARVMQEIPVQPNRCYRVTAWVKTENFAPVSSLRVQVLALDGRALAPWAPNVPATTDWRKLVFGFNSGNYDKIRLYAGAWAAQSGKFWFDDLSIEEAGLINVLRRPGTPVRVESEQTGTVYEEGADYQYIADPQLNFRFDHDGPAIRLIPLGRISEGEKLRVSYYHGMSVNDGQVTACMSEPAVYDILASSLKLIHELLAPKKYMLSIDEIRAGGTDESCKQRGMTMGEILGDYVTRGVQMIREVNPEAEVLAWSDMLDPNHNAHGNYYLVEGDYTGSWDHVPRDLIIVTWYYARRIESLRFFSGLGFRTLAGAYYDGDTLDNPKGWLAALKDTPGASGIMYTTWQNKYGLLAGFGDLVSKPPDPLP